MPNPETAQQAEHRRPVLWSFGEGPMFPGVTDETYWNGFLNVAVDEGTWPYVLRELIAGADEDAETIAAYRAMKPDNGTISLACGFATVEVHSLWQREFPDFPITTMPPIPGPWRDASWHNETAPAFSPCTGPMGEAARIWIDYADPTAREFPDLPRFTLCRPDTRGDLQNVYTGDNYDELLEHAAREALACAFAKRLALLLSADEWREMRLRNRSVAETVCASHDFIDSNLVMLAAWEAERTDTLRDLPGNGEIGSDFEHVNAAWAIATQHYLTASEEGARFDDWRLTGHHVDSLIAAGQDLGAEDGYDSPGRVYEPGFMEASDAGWLLNIANTSEVFADLAEAEAHLWSAYAAAETRHLPRHQPV
ncbi:hypothetical protein [Sphingomonas lacusdianchii]|uniref:hypothetical protein n=1 Tax=Sphingomonas lacusdianchii TaxID=2917992 RepID=UPI001F56C6DF|nr:hypothetical protein [Sphingomonas sp. JXJ CY 53]